MGLQRGRFLEEGCRLRSRNGDDDLVEGTEVAPVCVAEDPVVLESPGGLDPNTRLDIEALREVQGRSTIPGTAT